MTMTSGCLFMTFILCSTHIANAQIQSSTIPTVSGNPVRFKCDVTNAGKIAWDKTDRTVIAVESNFIGNYVNSSRFSLVTDVDGKQTLSIGAVEIQDDATYRCYGLNNNTRMDLFVLKVLVYPSTIKISNLPDQIDEGSTQTLTCTADDAKPPPVMEWLLIGPNTNRTQLKGVEDVAMHPDGTWRKRSNLTFIVVREMYQATIICTTSIAFFYNETNEITLDVNLAPLTPNMGYFTGLFDDNTMQTISCESDGSRPSGTVDFYLNGAKLDNTVREVYPKSDGTYSVVGRISLKFTKPMDGSKFSCNVTNSVVKNRGLTVSELVVLLATYAPIIISDNGTRVITENKDVVLTCLIDARPMPITENVFWRRNGQVVSGSRYNISKGRNADLYINSVKRSDIGDYVCQASNRLGITSGQPLHLDVLYSPVCTRSGVAKFVTSIGGSVKLLCHVEGNPGNSTITWRYTTRNVIIKPNEMGTPVNGRPRETTSMTYISVQSQAQYSDIECRATNAIGVSSKPCLFQIARPGPPEIPKNCSSHALSQTEIEIQCVPGFNGGSEQFFILQTLVSSQYETTDNSTSADFVVDGLLSGTSYTFRICASSKEFSLMSCSDSLSVNTEKDPSVSPQVVSAGVNAVPYVLGGVFCFLSLLILVAVGIYCYRKRQKKGNHVQSTFNKNNFSISDLRSSGSVRYVKPNNSRVVDNKDDSKHMSKDPNIVSQTPSSDNQSEIMHNAFELKYKDSSADHYVNIESCPPADRKSIDSPTPSETEIEVYRNISAKWLNSYPSHKKMLESPSMSILPYQSASHHALSYSEADINEATNVNDNKMNNAFSMRRSMSLEDVGIDRQDMGTIRLRCKTHQTDTYNDRNLIIQDAANGHKLKPSLKGDKNDPLVADPTQQSIAREEDSTRESKEEDTVRNSCLTMQDVDLQDIRVLKDRPRRISYNMAMSEEEDSCTREFLRASAMALDQLDSVLSDAQPRHRNDSSCSSISSQSENRSEGSYDDSLSEDNDKGNALFLDDDIRPSSKTLYPKSSDSLVNSLSIASDFQNEQDINDKEYKEIPIQISTPTESHNVNANENGVSPNNVLISIGIPNDQAQDIKDFSGTLDENPASCTKSENNSDGEDNPDDNSVAIVQITEDGHISHDRPSFKVESDVVAYF